MVSHRRILGTCDDSTNICLLCLAIALETGTYGTENKNHADVCFFFKLTTTTILVDFFFYLRGRVFFFSLSFLFSPLWIWRLAMAMAPPLDFCKFLGITAPGVSLCRFLLVYKALTGGVVCHQNMFAFVFMYMYVSVRNFAAFATTPLSFCLFSFLESIYSWSRWAFF